jgi:hypothetical protein
MPSSPCCTYKCVYKSCPLRVNTEMDKLLYGPLPHCSCYSTLQFRVEEGLCSKPFVAHADEQKRCYSEPPKHQPLVDMGAQPPKTSRTCRATAGELADNPDSVENYQNQQSDEQEYDSDTQPTRGARNRMPPRPYSLE